MIGAMTLLDQVNFIAPPGPGPDPGDDFGAVNAALSKLSPNGQRTAFAFLVASPSSTGLSGAARSDYFRYVGVAAALGLVVGAAAMFAIKR